MLVNTRSNYILEPHLLVPNRKPLSKVVLDEDNGLYGNIKRAYPISNYEPEKPLKPTYSNNDENYIYTYLSGALGRYKGEYVYNPNGDSIFVSGEVFPFAEKAVYCIDFIPIGVLAELQNIHYAIIMPAYQYGIRSSESGKGGATRPIFSVGIGSGYDATGPEFIQDEINTACLVFDGSGSTNADRMQGWLNGQKLSLTYTDTVPTSIPQCIINPSMSGSNILLSSMLFLNNPVSDRQMVDLYRNRYSMLTSGIV